jgi:hypothetical protein
MATSCPENPPPPGGTRVWRKAVPPALTQWAMDLRDHVSSFPYGQVWTTSYNGEVATARKDHHTWTYRKAADGSVTLVTGICIPGITLYEPLPSGVTAPDPSDLITPDPSYALYGVDAPPPSSTNWGLVLGSAAALAGVIGLFLLARHYGGQAARDNPLRSDRFVLWWVSPETRRWEVYRFDLTRAGAERLERRVRTVLLPRWGVESKVKILPEGTDP